MSEDPSFKPQGGNLGEKDMDYDTDEKTMADLRRQLMRAREGYYRYKSEYLNFVTEALELEDTMKNYEHRSATGWTTQQQLLPFVLARCSIIEKKFISSFRPERGGKVGSFLDVGELIWRCVLRKQLEKFLAILLGCMSAAILLAEATILPSQVDLSLFSILINLMNKNEVLVQIAAFVPLLYMCVCTYYSLFKIGMLTFYSWSYSLTPRQTSSVSLLMICSMVARYAPPIAYNFLNLIHLDKDAKTMFEKRMGNIDDAVPFFGKGFNKIYPLIMVIYTILTASNFFDHIINYFGNWKLFRFLRQESDDLDGYDQGGIMVLQKERSWLQQGHKVGELVVPLARSFNDAITDLESASSNLVSGKTQASSSSIPLKSVSEDDPSRKSISKKYAPVRSQPKEKETDLTSSNHAENSGMHVKQSSGLASTWESMKAGLQNFKSNIEAKKFIPLRQVQDAQQTRVPSSESLDDIFERIRKPTVDHTSYDSDDDLDDYAKGIRRPGRSR